MGRSLWTKASEQIANLMFFRHHHVCPWWLCFTFDNVFRKLVHDPVRILGPWVRMGSTVLDLGPGMGYFTIPMARMVGETGKVIAVDLQEKMLEAIRRRAVAAGVENRVLLHLSGKDRIGIDESVDFCLAFWMMHEVPNPGPFLGELASIIKEKGSLLIVEPRFHVSKKAFAETADMAKRAGFFPRGRPGIALSRAALLGREKR